MWNVFKAEEIIDFAVQIEKNGEKFYQALAEKMEPGDLKDIIIQLAAEEAKHIVDFQSILGDLKEQPINESYAGEYEEYVKGLAENHVFTKGVDEVIAELDKPADGLSTALQFEKDSIIFFHELKEMVSKANAEVIKRLINEEKNHIARLISLKKQYDCVCLR